MWFAGEHGHHTLASNKSVVHVLANTRHHTSSFASEHKRVVAYNDAKGQRKVLQVDAGSEDLDLDVPVLDGQGGWGPLCVVQRIDGANTLHPETYRRLLATQALYLGGSPVDRFVLGFVQAGVHQEAWRENNASPLDELAVLLDPCALLLEKTQALLDGIQCPRALRVLNVQRDKTNAQLL